MQSLMNETLIKLETLQNMLVEVATGGVGDEVEYKRLRGEILNISEIKDLLPQFLHTNRTTGQFWQFIKFKFPTYAERRKFIWDEFTQALDHVEGKRQGIAEKNISAKIDKFSQSYINAEWIKALERKIEDPEGAITTARTLLETTCKFILDNLQVTYKDD